MLCHNTLLVSFLILYEGTGVLFSSAPLVPTNPGNRTFFLLGSTKEVILLSEPLSDSPEIGKMAIAPVWPNLLSSPPQSLASLPVRLSASSLSSAGEPVGASRSKECHRFLADLPVPECANSIHWGRKKRPCWSCLSRSFRVSAVQLKSTYFYLYLTSVSIQQKEG